MDLARLEDDINRLKCEIEDRQVLGLALDSHFWSEAEKTRLKLANLTYNGTDLHSVWNSFMLDINAPPQMMVETFKGGYSDFTHGKTGDNPFNLDSKPFKDDPIFDNDGDGDNDDNNHIDMDDTQLFIHNTQLQDTQDNHLETLHASVKTQKHIANTINTHLHEDAIILGDLENQIDRTHTRVNHTRGRLDTFQQQSRNSSWLWREWLIIFALLVLLMLILKI